MGGSIGLSAYRAAVELPERAYSPLNGKLPSGCVRDQEAAVVVGMQLPAVEGDASAEDGGHIQLGQAMRGQEELRRDLTSVSGA